MKFAIRSLLGSLALGISLAGCGSSGDMLQPTGTVIVEGEPTKLVAPADGQVSVYDLGDDQTIWNGAIKKGQTLELDPMTKQLTLDGLACNKTPLGGGHTLKISFDKTN